MPTESRHRDRDSPPESQIDTHWDLMPLGEGNPPDIEPRVSEAVDPRTGMDSLAESLDVDRYEILSRTISFAIII